MKQYFPANLTKVSPVFRAYPGRPKLVYVTGLLVFALTLVWLPLPVSLAAGSDGTIDHTFQSGKGPDSSINAITVVTLSEAARRSRRVYAARFLATN